MGFAGMGTVVNPMGGYSPGVGTGNGGMRKRHSSSSGGGYDDDFEGFKKAFGKLSGMFPTPNVRQPFDRSADLSIVNAGGQADQAKADFMATGGHRFGPAGQLIAGAARADLMRPAEAEAAGFRARGAEAQLAADAQHRNFIADLLRSMWQRRVQQRELDLRNKYLSKGGQLGQPGWSISGGASYNDDGQAHNAQGTGAFDDSPFGG